MNNVIPISRARTSVRKYLSLEQATLLEENAVAAAILTLLYKSPTQDKSYSFSFLHRGILASARNHRFAGLDEYKIEDIYEAASDLCRKNLVSIYTPPIDNRRWRAKKSKRLRLLSEFHTGTQGGDDIRRILGTYMRYL
ncbi:hypothetical protein J4230_04175 [Candidatus Woesearchaeota archaeon]|nr:hypothetical protein [Candidatus Woesearchaeota archaeon]